MVSLKLQKRLAASVLGCGKNKVWLDPNEVNEISVANSSKFSRSLHLPPALGSLSIKNQLDERCPQAITTPHKLTSLSESSDRNPACLSTETEALSFKPLDVLTFRDPRVFSLFASPLFCVT